jgi:transposase
MSKIRRVHPAVFKQSVVSDLISGTKTLGQLSREHLLSPKMIRRWRVEWEKKGAFAFVGAGRPATEEARIADLERLAGQQAMEIAFLKKVLARFQQRSLAKGANTAKKSRK